MKFAFPSQLGVRTMMCNAPDRKLGKVAAA
jgi:hypothetical protein